MLVHEILEAYDPTKVCIFDEKRTLSYQELCEESTLFAVDLVRNFGIKHGERIAIFLPNCWQFVVALYGVWKAGAVPVLVDYRSSSNELAFFVKDSDSRVLIADRPKLEFAIEVPSARIISVDTQETKSLSNDGCVSTVDNSDIPSSSLACLMYTGGTTGTPKAAMLTHDNIISVLWNLAKAWKLRKGSEVFAQFLPMTHGGGLNCNINSALFSKGTTVIMRKFNAEKLLRIIEQYGVTAFAGVPTVFSSLLRSPQLSRADIRSLRICFSSGAPLSEEIVREFKAKTNITINVGWGLTEASPQLTVAPLGTYKPNYVGVPIGSTEIVTVDRLGRRLAQGEHGELAAKGPQIMKGYWNKDKATVAVFTAEGYLLTGDTGYIASDGVYVLGRNKDAINSGGYKIWPAEVESILLENPHVAEVAVVGIKDQFYGEAVKAYVVLNSEISDNELRQFCKQRMSGFKVPRYFEFRKSLPKSSVGKVLYRVLKESEEVSLNF